MSVLKAAHWQNRGFHVLDRAVKLYAFLLFSLSLHLALYGLLKLNAKDPITTDISVLELGTFSKSSRGDSLNKTENEKPKKKLIVSSEADAKKTSHSISKAESSGGDANSAAFFGEGGAGDIESPRVIKEAFALYPKSAKNAGIEGVVEMQLIIDINGKVESAEILRGPGYGLNEAALGVIKDFIFSPAKRMAKE